MATNNVRKKFKCITFYFGEREEGEVGYADSYRVGYQVNGKIRSVLVYLFYFENNKDKSVYSKEGIWEYFNDKLSIDSVKQCWEEGTLGVDSMISKNKRDFIELAREERESVCFLWDKEHGDYRMYDAMVI